MLAFYLSLIDNKEEKQRFQIVYEKYKQLFYNVAFGYVQDMQLAEDCVHDAFVAIAKSFSRVCEQEETAAVAYMLTVVRTCSMRTYSRQHKSDILPPNAFEGFPDEDDGNEADEGALQAAIRALPDMYREPLLLRYFSDYSYEHIAKLCGISNTAARKRVERAKNMLREMLDKEN